MVPDDIRLNPLAYLRDSRLFRLLMADEAGRFRWKKASVVLFLPSLLCLVPIGMELWHAWDSGPDKILTTHARCPSGVFEAENCIYRVNEDGGDSSEAIQVIVEAAWPERDVPRNWDLRFPGKRQPVAAIAVHPTTRQLYLLTEKPKEDTDGSTEEDTDGSTEEDTDGSTEEDTDGSTKEDTGDQPRIFEAPSLELHRPPPYAEESQALTERLDKPCDSASEAVPSPKQTASSATSLPATATPPELCELMSTSGRWTRLSQSFKTQFQLVADLLLYPLGGLLCLIVLANARRLPGNLRDLVDADALTGTPQAKEVAAIAASGFAPSRTYTWMRIGVALLGFLFLISYDWIFGWLCPPSSGCWDCVVAAGDYMYGDLHNKARPLVSQLPIWPDNDPDLDFGQYVDLVLSQGYSHTVGFVTFGIMRFFNWVLVGPLVVTAILVFIRSLNRLVGALRAAGAFRVRVLHPDGAGGLARLGEVALHLNLCVSLAAVLLLVKLVMGEWSPMRLAAALAVASMLCVVFFGTLYQTGEALKDERRRFTAMMVARHEALEQTLRGLLSVPTPDEAQQQELDNVTGQLDTLNTLRTRISKLPTWPWNLWTRGGLAVLVLSTVGPPLLKWTLGHLTAAKVPGVDIIGKLLGLL